MATQEGKVYGRDTSLFTLPMDRGRRRTPETVSRFRSILSAIRQAERDVDAMTERRTHSEEAVLALSDTLLANYYRPSRPTRRMLGGHISYCGPVKGLSVADMVDKPVVDAVRNEMHRRGIGDLWQTRLADEICEAATDSLVLRDGPHDAETPQEAARYAVAAVIDAGRHKEARGGSRLDAIIAEAVRKRW